MSAFYHDEEALALLLSATASQEAQEKQDGSNGNEKVAHIHKLQDTGGQRAKRADKVATVNTDPDPNAQECSSANLGKKENRVISKCRYWKHTQ